MTTIIVRIDFQGFAHSSGRTSNLSLFKHVLVSKNIILYLRTQNIFIGDYAQILVKWFERSKL